MLMVVIYYSEGMWIKMSKGKRQIGQRVEESMCELSVVSPSRRVRRTCPVLPATNVTVRVNCRQSSPEPQCPWSPATQTPVFLHAPPSERKQEFTRKPHC